MTRIKVQICLILFASFIYSHACFAQQNKDSISGYWKQEGASVYIHVVETGSSYQAEIVRNDWAPALVGTLYFRNAVPDSKRKKRWIGESLSPNSDQVVKANLRLSPSGILKARFKPGGRTSWQKTQPIEKRY